MTKKCRIVEQVIPMPYGPKLRYVVEVKVMGLFWAQWSERFDQLQEAVKYKEVLENGPPTRVVTDDEIRYIKQRESSL